MPDQRLTSNSARYAQTTHGGAKQLEGLAGEPSMEETAAIIAVLSLMQTEAPADQEAPRASAWARAGRREAVRPWTRQA
jgi:hypothetical protein